MAKHTLDALLVAACDDRIDDFDLDSPARFCRHRLEALATEYAVDELVVVTITETWETRVRSYELLAGAFELTPRG